MTMMSADGLVVAMARGAIKDRGDLRTAAGRGDVDIARAVQRACEQIDHRDQHGQQAAPFARTAGSQGLAVGGHDVTLIAVGARPSMAAGTVSTCNIVTSLEQLPQQRVRPSLTSDDASMRGNGFDDGHASWLGRFAAVAGLDGHSGATTRLHRPFQPFDGFIDPLIVVVGIGEGLLPECVGLMQARRSAIHAASPDLEVPPRSHL